MHCARSSVPVPLKPRSRSAARAAGLLDGELRVEAHHGGAREHRVLLVEIAPTSLRDADRRIAHVREHGAQKVRRDDEVGVEQRDELGVRVRSARSRALRS